MKSFFFILKYTFLKYTYKAFMFKFDLNAKRYSYFSCKRTMLYRRKLFIEKNTFFSVDYIKIIKLHVVHT